MNDIKLVMTLLVRNEEDIIEENIRFHYAQGVDSFIVMDNLSTDRTASIVQNLSREIDIEYLYQSQDDYNQSSWVSEMAHRARTQHNANWVINSDADEFWLSGEGTLRSFIASQAQNVGVLRLRRHNAVLCWDGGDGTQVESHPESSEIFESISVNNLGDELPGKCIHRASDKIVVAQGNHDVDFSDGRTVDVLNDAYILHFPYRSIEQYKSKIRLGGAAYSRNTSLPETAGYTWREHYKVLKSSSLDPFWENMCRPKREVLVGRVEGTYFRNRTVLDFLRNRRKSSDRTRLGASLDKFVTKTDEMVMEMIEAQTRLLMDIPEWERKNRPLYYNLQFCVSGPERHLENISNLPIHYGAKGLCNSFGKLRDVFSLFPQNKHFITFLGELLDIRDPGAAKRFREDCDGRPVVLHISCSPKVHLAEASIASFKAAGDNFHHIIVVGSTGANGENEVELSIDYDGARLTVPVPDNYENLHRKVFYALTLIHVLAAPTYVVKVDDNLVLKNFAELSATLTPVSSGEVSYLGREVGGAYHHTQWHGWHVGKCENKNIEERGYQYPLPKKYAAGGYGYALGKEGIEACAYMYLAMKEFFAMEAVGLEDAYVGHAMYAQGIEIYNVASEANLLALPGLSSSEADYA